MPKKHLKHYLFASDFDQTLTFNDTGYVLSELVGISVEEFERKIKVDSSAWAIQPVVEEPLTKGEV